AFSFVAVLLGLFLMTEADLRPAPRFSRPTSAGAVFTNLAEGLHYVRQTGIIFLAIVIVGTVATFGMNFSILIPPLAADVLKVGASGYGFLMAASGVGSLLAALAIAFGGTKAIRMLIGAIVLGVMEVVMGLVTNYPADLVLMFCAGAGAISMMATANTVIQMEVPDELRGRVMSVYTTVFAGTSPIGGLLFGAIAANAGAQEAIGIGGAVSVVAAIVGLIWYRRLPRTTSLESTLRNRPAVERPVPATGTAAVAGDARVGPDPAGVPVAEPAAALD
ncbi:MAG: MFS transporter, partial [Candidatus Limnocylindrales bacterium]